MAGSIRIESASYSYAENDVAGGIDVRLIRTDSTAGRVEVGYATTQNTATAGEDFTAVGGTAVFEEGESSKVVRIAIGDDGLAEGTERFNFVINSVVNASLAAPRTADISILDDEAPSPVGGGEDPFRYPVTVETVTVVEGLVDPIAIQWLPGDPGIMLVAQKPGSVVVIRDGVRQATPFLDISAQVNASGDRGLLDMELDPDFATNPYVYVTYVYDPPETAANVGTPSGPDGVANRPARVSRFDVVFDAAGIPRAVESSEQVLVGAAGTWENISGPGVDSTVDLDQPPSGIDPDTGENLKDYLAVDSTTHAPGDIEFGPDGALYVTVGDGTSYNAVDPRSFRVQDVDNLSGKLLRVDRATGLGLADNPFYDGDPTSNASKVYQLGLRNGFRFEIDQTDGRPYIGDVGWTLWEQIESGGPGANFGWPFYEGGDGVSAQQPLYADLAEARAFYAAVQAGTITVTAPHRAFSHDPAQPGPDMQAIVVGDIYTGNAYPDILRNDLFFADLGGRVYTMDLDDPNRTVRTLAQGSFYVDFVQGPDGKVYMPSLVDGTIKRFEITAGLPPDLEFAIADFGDAPALNYNGTAAASGTAARLTPAVNPFEAGSVFHNSLVLLGPDTSFSSAFGFRMAGGDGAEGSDGFAFVIQNSSNGSDALGYAGGGLGYSGMATSIAVAFDTYRNDGDTGGNNVLLLRDGDVFAELADVAAPFDLNGSAAPRYAWVEYDGPTNQLRVYLSQADVRPAAALITATLDLPTLLGGEAHVGFTAATGGFDNQHDVLGWDFASGSVRPPAGSVITIAADAAARVEGDAGVATDLTFTVSRAGAAAGAASVAYAVRGTDAAPASAADFAGGALPAGRVTFAAGETSRTLTVRVAGDLAVEEDETFSVVLSAPSGATLGAQASAAGTILNDDVPPPVVAIAAATASRAEGGAGVTTDLTFTVSRAGSVAGASTVAYAVAGSGGAPASAADFAGGALPSGTVAFAAGETARTLTVRVAGDAAVEGDETFEVVLSAPSGATLGAEASAAGTILNDDVPPAVAIAAAGASRAEGGVGVTTDFTFTVSRSGSSAGASTVAYAVGGTGSAPASAADFAGGALPSGTVAFAAGETARTLTIRVAGDAAAEANETFAVVLSAPTGATLGAEASAAGTILNDDGAAPAVTIAAAGASRAEGGAGVTTDFTFTVSRSGSTAGAASVAYAVGGNGAAPASASDFAGGALPSGTVAFAAGQASRTLTVRVAGDAVLEGDETFAVVLSAPTGATLGAAASATGTIVNDEPIVGGSGNDLLQGGLGNDNMSGNDGRDTLRGGVGDDWMSGGAGDDSMSGGAGNDLLEGGNGADRLLGEAGNDVFLLHRWHHPGAGLRDEVLDFFGAGVAGGDVLRLAGHSAAARFEYLRNEGGPATQIYRVTDGTLQAEILVRMGDGSSAQLGAGDYAFVA